MSEAERAKELVAEMNAAGITTMARCPEWRAKVFEVNDIAMGEPTHGFRYIVGRSAGDPRQPFEELFLAASVNAAAALFVVADRWGSGDEIQVIGLEDDCRTYTFDTGRGGDPPMRLAEADVVKEDDSCWLPRRVAPRGEEVES